MSIKTLDQLEAGGAIDISNLVSSGANDQYTDAEKCTLIDHINKDILDTAKKLFTQLSSGIPNKLGIVHLGSLGAKLRFDNFFDVLSSISDPKLKRAVMFMLAVAMSPTYADVVFQAIESALTKRGASFLHNTFLDRLDKGVRATVVGKVKAPSSSTYDPQFITDLTAVESGNDDHLIIACVDPSWWGLNNGDSETIAYTTYDGSSANLQIDVITISQEVLDQNKSQANNGNVHSKFFHEMTNVLLRAIQVEQPLIIGFQDELDKAPHFEFDLNTAKIDVVKGGNSFSPRAQAIQGGVAPNALKNNLPPGGVLAPVGVPPLALVNDPPCPCAKKLFGVGDELEIKGPYIAVPATGEDPSASFGAAALEGGNLTFTPSYNFEVKLDASPGSKCCKLNVEQSDRKTIIDVKYIKKNGRSAKTRLEFTAGVEESTNEPTSGTGGSEYGTSSEARPGKTTVAKAPNNSTRPARNAAIVTSGPELNIPISNLDKKITDKLGSDTSTYSKIEGIITDKQTVIFTLVCCDGQFLIHLGTYLITAQYPFTYDYTAKTPPLSFAFDVGLPKLTRSTIIGPPAPTG